MLTKEQREEMRRQWAAQLADNKYQTPPVADYNFLALIDALDEMERERDAEKKIADVAREWVAVHQDKANAAERVRYDCALGSLLNAVDPDGEDDDQ